MEIYAITLFFDQSTKFDVNIIFKLSHNQKIEIPFKDISVHVPKYENNNMDDSLDVSNEIMLYDSYSEYKGLYTNIDVDFK